MKDIKGENNPNWKGGWKNELPNCIDCGTKLSWHKGKRCTKCYHKNQKGKKNKPMSETGRMNISKAQIGRKNSKDHRENISKARKGIKFSKVVCENMSKVGLERWQDNGYREKTINRMNDPIVKEKHKKSCKESANRPDVRQKKKEIANKLETKEKRAISLAKHLANGTVKYKMFDTKPELKVLASYISKGYKEGIDIIKQKYIKMVGMVDFYLPKENTLIFVDGDYWHCNPAKYKPCFYQGQSNMFAKQIWDKDNAITQKAEELGYEVRRLWESDINNLIKSDFKNKTNNIGR